MSKEKIEEPMKINQEIIDLFQKTRENLPDDCINLIPTESVVTIQVDGGFFNSLQALYGYVQKTMPENIFEEAVKSCNLLAEAMKDDTIDLTRVEISDQARALWTLIRLQNEIRFQAGIQGVTRVYDKDKYLDAAEKGLTVDPLDPKERDKRFKVNNPVVFPLKESNEG